MVEGRSSREMVECRLGTPTVDAGEGGLSCISSTGSAGEAGARSEVGCVSACWARSNGWEALRPNIRVREADRFSEEAKSSMELRLRVDSDLDQGATQVRKEFEEAGIGSHRRQTHSGTLRCLRSSRS
jgi:hypothetical protein